MSLVTWLAPAVDERAFTRWRRLTGVAMAVYLLVRVRPLTSSPDLWEPVLALRWLSGPLPSAVLWGLWIVALIGSVEWVWRAVPVRSLPQFGAIALFVLLGHRSSGGQILWFDILPVLHVLTLAAAGSRFDPIRAGWAMRLAALTTVITYVLAGIAKLRYGGLEWVGEGALERNVAFSAARFEAFGGTPSPAASALADLGLASVVFSIAVVLIELAAPIALFGRRRAWVWSGLAWVMHVVIALTMFVVFHWPLVGLAFFPLVQLADDRAAIRSSSS